MDADASAALELEDDSLSAGLDAVAAKFAAIAGEINSSFAAANAQLTRTAGATAQIGASAGLMTAMGTGMMLAARAAQMVSTTMSGIVTTVTRLAPLIRYVPDSLGKWVTPLKEAAEGVARLTARLGVVTKTCQTITGNLTVLNAGFLALELRELGATKAMALLGSASALATSKMIAGLRGAMGLLTGMGSSAANVSRRVGSGLGGAFSGVARHVSLASMAFAPMAGMALALGPIGAAALGIAGGFHEVHRAIGAAAESQSLQASFVTLLGSADKARARMAELSKFAQETPFDIPQVTRASKELETLTRGALSTGAGLRMVGDLASVSGQPMQDLALHVGRLYDGMMNGRPVGESLMRLQELGLVSSATRSKLEQLQAAGQKGNAVWSVAATDLMRFSGEMSRQSLTWSGMMSNVSDGIGNVFRAFGAPIITALTPFMLRLINWLGTLTAWASKAGSIFAGWSALIAQIFADGKMGAALMLVGKIAFAESANFLLAALVGVGAAFVAVLAGGIKAALTVLSAMNTLDFWRGLSNALSASAHAMNAILYEGVAQIVEKMKDIPGFGKTADQGAKLLRLMGGNEGLMAKRDALTAGNQLAPLSRGLESDFKKTMQDMGKSFTAARNSVGNVFNADGARGDLMKLIHGEWASAGADISKAAAALEKGGLPATKPNDPTGAGKDKSEVASLQKVGLGGLAGFGGDPLLNTANAQLTETRNLRGDVQKLTTTVAGQRPGSRIGVFG